jgi:hypothetical protein
LTPEKIKAVKDKVSNQVKKTEARLERKKKFVEQLEQRLQPEKSIEQVEKVVLKGVQIGQERLKVENIGQPLQIQPLVSNVIETPVESKVIVPITNQINTVERDLLQEGLKEIMWKDIPGLLQNGIVLLKAENRACVIPCSEGKAALWAKFALPWLERHFPNFSADKIFYIFTVVTLGSMVQIKKIEEVEKENKDV